MDIDLGWRYGLGLSIGLKGNCSWTLNDTESNSVSVSPGSDTSEDISKTVTFDINYEWGWSLNENVKNGVFTLGVTVTGAGGIIGGSFELGLTFDFRNGLQVGGYGVIEHAVGADYSLGFVLNYHFPKPGVENFSIKDLEGYGDSYNVGIGSLDLILGGNALIDGFNMESYPLTNTIYTTIGIGYSPWGNPAVGFSRHKGYTVVTETIKF